MLLNWLVVPAIVLSALMFVSGAALERRVSSRAARLALFFAACGLAIPGLLFVLYYFHFFDNAGWFYEFRAVEFVELTASGLGLIGGVGYSWFRPITAGEKAITPVVVALMILAPHAKPVLVTLDTGRLNDACHDGVCLQSTESTCGPASAATVLTMLGHPTSEKQLASECHTYSGGTESWYLARAFRRRGLDARFVVTRPDATSLPAPAIAGVVLRGGAGHFVAVLSETADDVTIADPLSGRFVVKKADLKRRYRFTGFFLSIRRPGTQTSP